MTTSNTPTLLLLFNHQLTVSQDSDARASLGVERIVNPPPEISRIWAEIPPEAEEVGSFLAPVAHWMATASRPGDFVLIQGDFSATYLMVSKALRLNLIPISSTTRRQAMEEHMPDGSVHLRHIFTHVRYRRYIP
jgi:hypothetical protein